MYQQRVASEEPPEPDLESPLWTPAPVRDPRLDAWYLTVDELDGTTATMVAAPWPHDRFGRLVFGPPRRRRSVHRPVEDLLEVVSAARREADDPAAQRPIRIGDTFYVEAPHGPDGRWAHVVDVTAEARDAAKAALYSAVAPRVDEEYAASVGLGDLRRPGEPRPRPAADRGDQPDERDRPPPRQAPPGPTATPGV